MDIESKKSSPAVTTPELRLDKWLWAARLFKTRGLAAKAVSSGKVHLGGRRVKPAKLVRAGDELVVRRGVFEQELKVLSISDKRRPAPEARLMYRESEQSIAKRQELLAQLRLERALPIFERAAGRPNKKQRRQIISFTKRSSPQERE
jgi:ribosome-associated heat shock protein Hsp15